MNTKPLLVDTCRSRRDCGNREAADILAFIHHFNGRSRRDCGNREAGRWEPRNESITAAAVAATAAIVRRFAFSTFEISIACRSRRDCGNREADFSRRQLAAYW